jgi:hypothetical protein
MKKFTVPIEAYDGVLMMWRSSDCPPAVKRWLTAEETGWVLLVPAQVTDAELSELGPELATNAKRGIVFENGARLLTFGQGFDLRAI